MQLKSSHYHTLTFSNKSALINTTSSRSKNRNTNSSSHTLFYYIISMSLFYQVVGATRCPKIKKHAGIKLRPINKAKEPFTPGDVFIYSCESAEFTQSIKCLDDGNWSDVPHCPDPVNSTCPELGPVSHGSFNSSGTLKVGSIVMFRCDNEIVQGQQGAQTNNSINTRNQSQISLDLTPTTRDIELTRYSLIGPRLIKCLPSSKWSHQQPYCSPVNPDKPSTFVVVMTPILLILIPILIIAGIIQLFTRWKKRQQQRERWKQYFTDYKYRHSKTNIAFSTRPQSSNSNVTIPVTDL